MIITYCGVDLFCELQFDFGCFEKPFVGWADFEKAVVVVVGVAVVGVVVVGVVGAAVAVVGVAVAERI